MALTKGTLTNTEYASFAGQMAMVLESGISPLEGLELLHEDAVDEQEKRLLKQLIDQFCETGVFWQAVESTGAFPEYMMQMLRLGEETGTLDEVLSSLQMHYEREEYISDTIKTALTYPMLMIGMMVLIVVVLLTKVMPVFQQVFNQLGREMSGFSLGILRAGTALSRYTSLFVALLVLICILLFYFTKTANGREKFVSIGYHIPYIRSIYEKTAVCRFADGMAISLKSGLPPESCLDLAGDLVDDTYFNKKLETCKSLLLDGTSLSDALKESAILSGMHARVAFIAGKAGKMEEAMEQIAKDHTDEMDRQITSFISALEPTLVMILSIIVGAIMFSVMLPLLGIMSSL